MNNVAPTKINSTWLWVYWGAVRHLLWINSLMHAGPDPCCTLAPCKPERTQIHEHTGARLDLVSSRSFSRLVSGKLPQVGHNANERRLIFPGNVHIGYGCILYILSSTTSLFPNFQLVIQWSGKENFANMDTSLHRMSNLPCIWCCIDTDVIVRIPQSIAAWQQCRDRDSNS